MLIPGVEHCVIFDSTTCNKRNQLHEGYHQVACQGFDRQFRRHMPRSLEHQIQTEYPQPITSCCSDPSHYHELIPLDYMSQPFQTPQFHPCPYLPHTQAQRRYSPPQSSSAMENSTIRYLPSFRPPNLKDSPAFSLLVISVWAYWRNAISIRPKSLTRQRVILNQTGKAGGC